MSLRSITTTRTGFILWFTSLRPHRGSLTERELRTDVLLLNLYGITNSKRCNLIKIEPPTKIVGSWFVHPFLSKIPDSVVHFSQPFCPIFPSKLSHFLSQIVHFYRTQVLRFRLF